MQDPFFYYSSSFPDFLQKKHTSLIFSTYQAGKVIIIGSSDGKSLQLFAKNFFRKMGIALMNNQLAIANKSKVDLFSNSKRCNNHKDIFLAGRSLRAISFNGREIFSQFITSFPRIRPNFPLCKFPLFPLFIFCIISPCD